MSRLTRATAVVQEGDAFLTTCRACKRVRDVGEPDFPSKRFGTRPEANDYLRLHEATSTHLENVARRAPAEPSKEEMLLRAIFGEVDPNTCETCGKIHASWMECDGTVRSRERDDA